MKITCELKEHIYSDLVLTALHVTKIGYLHLMEKWIIIGHCAAWPHAKLSRVDASCQEK